MQADAALSAFLTLFVVIDPVGLAPMFIALTPGMEAARRRRIAATACAIGLGILFIFGLFGTALLDGLGISLPAFRIAGGLLLFLIAVDMLFEKRTERREGRTHVESDPSVFPLATPLIAGPGAMAAMVLLTSQSHAGAAQTGVILAIATAVVAMCLVLFLVAGPIERLLGRMGILVVTRLFGMLLAALSVQFVLDGLTGVGLIPGAGGR